MLRNSPDLELCPERETRDSKGEGQRHLLLAPQHCPLCEEYRDCSACAQVYIYKITRDFINASGVFLPVSRLVKIRVYPGLM